jgi:hypothetical protein
MFRPKVILFFVISCFLLQACNGDTQAGIAKLEMIIKSKGISIHRLQSMDEVPIDGYVKGVTTRVGSSETNGVLKLLSDDNYLGSLEVIDEAISQYPADILSSALDSIYIGGKIQTDREQFTSGFIWPQKQDIYLFSTVQNDDSRSNSKEIMGTFHHEISSILMRKYRFDMIGFMSYNGAELEYWHDQARILENTSLPYYASEGLLNAGLLTHYSQTSPENDYNMYVEVAFIDPVRMSEFCSANERVERKYEHVKAFYLKISPDFHPVFNQIVCGDNNTQALTNIL